MPDLPQFDEPPECMYVDGIPVFVGQAHAIVHEWFAPLGDRVQWGTWAGEWPPTGELAEQSLVLQQEVMQFVPEENWP